MRLQNGDADACVPYKGNVEWIKSLVKQGDLTEKDAWRPWYNDVWPGMPAGYVTTYKVNLPLALPGAQALLRMAAGEGE